MQCPNFNLSQSPFSPTRFYTNDWRKGQRVKSHKTSCIQLYLINAHPNELTTPKTIISIGFRPNSMLILLISMQTAYMALQSRPKLSR